MIGHAAGLPPFPAGRIRQTILYNTFFLHRRFRSKPHRRPEPPPPAGRRGPVSGRYRAGIGPPGLPPHDGHANRPAPPEESAFVLILFLSCCQGEKRAAPVAAKSPSPDGEGCAERALAATWGYRAGVAVPAGRRPRGRRAYEVSCSRSTIQSLMSDCRGTPRNLASRSRASTTQAGKSTLTRLASRLTRRACGQSTCPLTSSPASNARSNSSAFNSGAFQFRGFHSAQPPVCGRGEPRRSVCARRGACRLPTGAARRSFQSR